MLLCYLMLKAFSERAEHSYRSQFIFILHAHIDELICYF
nr:MAG TPA: hypothetical protein [Caudoviricetes sp.]